MNKHIRQFLLFVGVGSLAFSLACGGGGNGGGFGSGGGGGTGSFTNASLSGQYVYQLKGYDLGTGDPFREAGVFTADGNGHITAGKDDFSIGTTVIPDTTTGGAYQVNGNGIATVQLNFASGSSSTFEITFSSSSQFYLIEIDPGISASGTAQKQDATAVTSLPSGTFVTRMHTVNNSQPIASTVGAFTVSNGSITGNMDRKTNSLFGSSTVTGTLNFPDSTFGRGSGTFVDSVAGTSTFVYYVVDASHLILFSTDSGTLGVGQAEKQTGTFTNASFTGPYAFGSNGDANGFEGTVTAGRFNADGGGGISAGVLDNVTAGTVANATFTGTYNVSTSGRAAVTLTSGSNNIQQVYWMVSPNRAFFITNSPTSIEDGSVDTQVGTFSAASLNGTYAFGITGVDSGNTNDLTGLLQANGTSTLSMALFPNVNGVSPNPIPLTTTNFTGTYTVANNGRAVGSLTNFSNNLVMYLVSPNNAYVIQADSDVELHGTITKQP